MGSTIKSTQKMLEVASILRDENGKIDVSANVRDIGESYSQAALEPLWSQMVEFRNAHPEVNGGSGIQNPIHVRTLPSGAYQIIKGHRRTIAAELQGIAKVPAIVYGEMDDKTFYAMVLDHGGEKGLTKVELFNSLAKAEDSGMSERERVIACRPTLEALYPLTKDQREKFEKLTTDDAREKFLVDRWRQHLQMCSFANRGPDLLRKVFLEKLRDGNAYPTLSDVREMYSAYLEDQKNPDPSVAIAATRSNPGPAFMEIWRKFENEVAEAKAIGRAPKSVGMRTREQAKNLLSKTESLFGKAYLWWVMNDPRLDDSKMLRLHRKLVQIESNLSPEDKKVIFDLIGKGDPLSTEAPTPTAAESAPAEVVAA